MFYINYYACKDSEKILISKYELLREQYREYYAIVTDEVSRLVNMIVVCDNTDYACECYDDSIKNVDTMMDEYSIPFFDQLLNFEETEEYCKKVRALNEEYIEIIGEKCSHLDELKVIFAELINDCNIKIEDYTMERNLVGM